jgi:phospho-N-acetylmuramoyl-pentapeptide-transferase
MRIELYIFIAFFLLSVGITFLLILFLSRAGVGSVIRMQGPASHIEKKDTPSLAGIGFIILLVLFGIIAMFVPSIDKQIPGVVIIAVAFGLIGLTDDLTKQFAKKSSGLKARYRIVLQILVALGFSTWLYVTLPQRGIIIPGLADSWDPGWWIIVIDVLLLAGFVNAFNFADGLDGLAAGLGILCFASLGFIMWTELQAFFGISAENAALWPVAVFVGISGGFLVFNWHPARIFMGDGGSYCLGGFIAAYAIAAGLHIALIIAGLVFAAEILSVVIQVISYRTTGKRVFAMTPIHHAFEVKGYKETRIVRGFWIAGGACALACYMLFTQMGAGR